MIKRFHNRSSPLSRALSYARLARDSIRGYATPYGIKIPLDRRLLGPRLRKYISRGEYEFDEIELIMKVILPGSKVLELGGGIGFVSAFLQRNVPQTHVTSFEANPKIAEFHECVMRLNGLRSFLLKNAVLGDDTFSNSVSFYLDSDFWGSSTYPRRPGQTSIAVPVINLNKFLNSESFDILVMDIEGGEYDVMMMLDAPAFKTIVMELHSDVLGEAKVGEMLNKLSKMGYRLVNAPAHGLPPICHFAI
jgi:FkbM family methyltransferase